MHQPFHRPEREQRTERSGHHGENDALGHHEPDQTGATRTKRGPHGEFRAAT
jgi:hypothetical protein